MTPGVTDGKEECLDRIVPLGEGHLRRTLQEFAVHYHRERNHQGLGNELIDRPTAQRPIVPFVAGGESAGSSATTTGRLHSTAAIQSWDRTASPFVGEDHEHEQQGNIACRLATVW
jgi:hypothetical protein